MVLQDATFNFHKLFSFKLEFIISTKSYVYYSIHTYLYLININTGIVNVNSKSYILYRQSTIPFELPVPPTGSSLPSPSGAAENMGFNPTQRGSLSVPDGQQMNTSLSM